MYLIIDNFDSFVYNLYQYLGEIIGEENLLVLRTNVITPAKIIQLSPEAIIISPGPGHPEDYPGVVEIVKRFSEKTPILGICLGHQILSFAFGATIRRAKRIMHGKVSKIRIIKSDTIFREIPEVFDGGRYHSLVADAIPESMEILARSEDDDEIMAVRHRTYPAYGIQFHPESVLTPEGKKIIRNFTEIVKGGSNGLQNAD